MEVLNAKIGQFFTPYEVSRMIAEMSLQDVAPVIEANGYVTVSEPACGAGGMVLAAADTLQKHGFDPSTQMLVNAVDISPLCFHMTYVQATLRGIPALVELGDTLRNTRTESAWTPAALPFYARHGRLFPARLSSFKSSPSLRLRSSSVLCPASVICSPTIGHRSRARVTVNGAARSIRPKTIGLPCWPFPSAALR